MYSAELITEIPWTFTGLPGVSLKQVCEKDVSFEPVRKISYSFRTPTVVRGLKLAVQAFTQTRLIRRRSNIRPQNFSAIRKKLIVLYHTRKLCGNGFCDVCEPPSFAKGRGFMCTDAEQPDRSSIPSSSSSSSSSFTFTKAPILLPPNPKP